MASSKQQQNVNLDPNRYPFWGLKIPKEARYLQQVCLNKIQNVTIDRACFREILKIAISALENNEPKFEAFKVISNENKIDLNSLLSVYSGLLKLLKCALRSINSTKQEIIKEDLKDQLKLPIEYVNDFASVIYGSKRETIERSLVSQRPRYPTLKAIDWRVDVSISTSSLMRTLEPSVMLKLKLSNGNKVSFELNVKKFHLLRYNIATILKEIDDVENRQIFKLFD